MSPVQFWFLAFLKNREFYSLHGFPDLSYRCKMITILVLALAVLSFLIRKRRPAFALTLVATICWTLAFPVIFFAFTEPVNTVFRQATPETVPANWMELRKQWEYSHAARFVFQFIGFGALVLSVVKEIPKQFSREFALYYS